MEHRAAQAGLDVEGQLSVPLVGMHLFDGGLKVVFCQLKAMVNCWMCTIFVYNAIGETDDVGVAVIRQVNKDAIVLAAKWAYK